MTGVSRFDKQLRFLDNTMRLVACVSLGRCVMAPEEIFCEFIAGIPVTQDSGLVEPLAKFTNDAVGIIFHVEELGFDERHGRLKHGAIRKGIRLRIIFAFEMELRFKHQPLGVRKIELSDGNHFTCALARSHIADCEFPGISPIGIEGTIAFIRGHFHEWLDHGAAFLLSDTFDEILEAFRMRAFANVSSGDGLNDRRNLL